MNIEAHITVTHDNGKVDTFAFYRESSISFYDWVSAICRKLPGVSAILLAEDVVHAKANRWIMDNISIAAKFAAPVGGRSHLSVLLDIAEAYRRNHVQP